MIDRRLLAHWEQARADAERAVEFAEGQMARITLDNVVELRVEDNEPPDVVFKNFPHV